MFKKIKENEKYKKYQELRSNPQTKAIISLGFYLVFFLIVILFVKVTTPSYQNSSKKTVNNISNYEYTYSNNKGAIFGKKYNDKQLFFVSSLRYYYNGKDTFLIKENNANIIPNFDLNILKIDYKIIDDLTKNLNPSQNDNVKKYIVPLSNFLNLYEIDTEADLTLASNYNIIIDKYYKEDDLYMVKIDLSNYYIFRNIENDGILTIEFYNKNKINDFTLEYDKMLGVVE